MKLVLTAGLALLLFGSPAAYAQDNHHEGEVRGIPHWEKGERVPDEYRKDQYIVADWRGNHLRRPPRGEHWIHVGDRFMLVRDNNGLVLDLRMGEGHH
jgi:Ni/Co efflux regulator RcnB